MIPDKGLDQGEGYCLPAELSLKPPLKACDVILLVDAQVYGSLSSCISEPDGSGIDKAHGQRRRRLLLSKGP